VILVYLKILVVAYKQRSFWASNPEEFDSIAKVILFGLLTAELAIAISCHFFLKKRKDMLTNPLQRETSGQKMYD
jgi:hypothetical protein